MTTEVRKQLLWADNTLLLTANKMTQARQLWAVWWNHNKIDYNLLDRFTSRSQLMRSDKLTRLCR
jgi:hypothetical protein